MTERVIVQGIECVRFTQNPRSLRFRFYLSATGSRSKNDPRRLHARKERRILEGSDASL
jgi:hypothetical protein